MAKFMDHDLRKGLNIAGICHIDTNFTRVWKERIRVTCRPSKSWSGICQYAAATVTVWITEQTSLNGYLKIINWSLITQIANNNFFPPGNCCCCRCFYIGI